MTSAQKARTEYPNFFLHVKGWEAQRLKGCIFSPPSLLPVPGGGKEARKQNLSIASNPVSVYIFCGGSKGEGVIKYQNFVDVIYESSLIKRLIGYSSFLRLETIKSGGGGRKTLGT